MAKSTLLVVGCAVLLFAVAAPAAEVPATQPAVTAEQRQAVTAALHEMRPYGPDVDAVASQLVALGKGYLPAIEEAAASPDKLVGAGEFAGNRYKGPNGMTLVDGNTPAKRAEIFRGARLMSLQRAALVLKHGSDPRDAILAWLAKERGGQKDPSLRPWLTYVDDAPVVHLFPGRVFCTYVVPQYPVALPVQPPLRMQNIFVVDSKNDVQLITDTKGLEAMFKENLPNVKDAAGAKDALRAWLRLGPEMVNDGMFSFSVPEEFIKTTQRDKAITAEGKAMVAGNGQGQVAAVMTFGEDGKLQSATLDAHLKAGVRPICQATKLLDPDPIVRRMAEQDLLIMGSAARPYLLEQRAKADPKLQQAIDQIWERILQRERE